MCASPGASTFPRDGETFEELARHAAIAKHRVKERGGNDSQFYERRMNDSAQQRLALEIELNRAVERGEFELHYQPKVDLESGAIRGAEALLRWKHPEGRCVPADEFIPILEAIGLIVEGAGAKTAADRDQLVRTAVPAQRPRSLRKNGARDDGHRSEPP
jgi:predicted signal transduction protein with EAL and GGDEF domain